MCKLSILVLVVGCVSPTTGERDQAIGGGSATTVGQYPTVVALDLPMNFSCSGTLIAPDLVLTAAHCVYPEEFGLTTQQDVTSAIQVHIDATGILGTGNPGHIVTASNSLPDPDYLGPNTSTPDLGLIWLATPITDRTPSAINFEPANAPVGIDVTLVGYGLDLDNPNEAIDGVEHALVAEPTTSCAPYQESDATSLCFDQSSGSGICLGDSGGPAFVNIGPVLMIAAVASSATSSCYGPGAGGTETRTDAAKAFFEQQAPELTCEADGTCDASCGSGALPVDPDCVVCTVNGDCGANMICTPVGQCEAGPPAAHSGGCAVGGGDSLVTVVVGALALVLRRRRTRLC